MNNDICPANCTVIHPALFCCPPGCTENHHVIFSATIPLDPVRAFELSAPALPARRVYRKAKTLLDMGGLSKEERGRVIRVAALALVADGTKLCPELGALAPYLAAALRDGVRWEV